MAIIDDTLRAIVEAIREDCQRAGLTRQRDGIARGIAWAELSGRADDGSWIELRLHHHPIDRTVQAGMLSYQPLARGGRTIVMGETGRLMYASTPSVVADAIASAVRGWLPKIGQEARP